MPVSVRVAFVAAFLLASTTPSLAQSVPSPQPSATPIPEIGRVSTSDRHDEPITNTTRPTFVVDRARIEAHGDRTIADALTGVPGLAIFRYGGFGAQAALYTHGTSSAQQILVLLDGVPLAPGSNGEVDLGTFSTVGVRRIEVVEGGGSTLYGTSAIGGVINIITGVPRGTYLEAATGSYGERDLRASAGVGGFGVSFERHLARNDYAYPALDGQPAGVRQNADAEQSAGSLSYDTSLGARWSLHARAGASSLSLGVPGSTIFGTSTTARLPTSANDARLELAHEAGNTSTFVTLAASQQKLAFIDPANPPQNDTLDGRTQISLREVLSGKRSTLVGGIDLARESAVLTNVGVYDANGNASYVTSGYAQAQSAAYLQEQTMVGSVRAVAGLRAEHDSPIASVLVPSLGVAVPLAPGLRLALNANGSFRVPTIIDLYYPGYANPALKPERSSDGDVTLQMDRLLGGAAVTWFGREATNLIQLDQNFVPQNIARASIRGVQATLRTRPLHGFVSTLAVTDLYRALNLSPGITATRLNFEPVFIASLGLEHPLGPSGLAFGATANLYGSHREPSGNNVGQTTVDAYIRGRLAPGALVSLRVRNLGDERYAPILGYPAPGRTFTFEVSTR